MRLIAHSRAGDEQQEDNAELGDMPDFLYPVDETEPPGADGGACSQVSQYRPETQSLKYRYGDDRCSQQDQDICKVMGFRHR
jgi:hypothetical protein